MQTNPNRVGAVQTTIEVIRALLDLEEATIASVAEEVGLSTSAVHNHLATLEEVGFVTREDGSFLPGYAFLEIGGRLRSDLDLYKYGRPEIDRLAKETGESSNLMAIENGQGVVLYLAKGDDAIQFDAYTGRRFNLHTNALGKAILSELPRERVETIVERYGLAAETENTITDEATLFEELEQVRERGIAFDDEERLEGLRCVASPVTVDGEVLGSISVSGPASRLKRDRFREELPEQVSRAAELVSINIQY